MFFIPKDVPTGANQYLQLQFTIKIHFKHITFKILTFLKNIVKLASQVPSARDIINVCDQHDVFHYLILELYQPTLYLGVTKYIHSKILQISFGNSMPYLMFAFEYLFKLNWKLTNSYYLVLSLTRNLNLNTIHRTTPLRHFDSHVYNKILFLFLTYHHRNGTKEFMANKCDIDTNISTTVAAHITLVSH